MPNVARSFKILFLPFMFCFCNYITSNYDFFRSLHIITYGSNRRLSVVLCNVLPYFLLFFLLNYSIICIFLYFNE